MNTVLKSKSRETYTWLSTCLVIFFFAGFQVNLFGQTNIFTNNASNDLWSDPGNWSLNMVPTSSHDVVLSSGQDCDVDINAVCASLTFDNIINVGGNLFITGTNSLQISGDLTINAVISGGGDRHVHVGSGSLICSNIIMTDGGLSGREAKLFVSSGSTTVTGNITMSAFTDGRNAIDLSNDGTLNLGGSISGGNLIRGNNSTVNFNGTLAQVLPTGYAYHNVTINNPAGVTLDGNLQHIVMGGNISGNLTVASGILNNGGYSIHLSNAHAFSVANGATFNLSGTSAMVTGAGTISFGSNSTINYTGSNQNVFAGSYGNLGLSGSGL